MSREVPAGRFFCMDEFHNHHMNDDVIRERLRSIDGRHLILRCADCTPPFY